MLTLAVGPPGFDDSQLAEAFSRLLAIGKSSLRLSIVHTSGPVDSVTKLARGEVQLAITRTDIKTGDAARAVARLHSDPVVILATAQSGATKLTDLSERSIGVIGPPDANNVLLDTLRRQYRAKFQTVEVQPSPTSIAAALRDRKISALLFVVPVARSSKVADSWYAVRKASRMSFRFIPIEEAEAIAASAPAYEEGEISSGQFGGSPLLPPDDVTTLEVATDLVADRNVPAEQITRLTRSLFEDRQKMVAESALASFVKTASTDKDAPIPVHPGAKVYYDGEEQTFIEKYGDWVYIIPIIFGALASAAMGVLRFLGLSGLTREPPLLAKVPEVIQAIDSARSTEELDSIRSRINAAVERVSMDAVEGRASEQNMSAIAIAVAHLDRLLRDRHNQLAGSQNAASSVDHYHEDIRLSGGRDE
jgi:TRAP transporter TAXI family solute receptor